MSTLKNHKLQYDKDNKACYITLAYIYYEVGQRDLYMLAFPSMGAAQNYFKPQITGDWEQHTGFVTGKLKRKTLFNKPEDLAYSIRLQSMLILSLDDCISEGAK